jgi:molybdopterin synthase sulfur carrier subunit
MALVWIPPLLRDLTGGSEMANVQGANVGQLIEALEQRYPGVRGRLCPDGVLRQGLALIVDG